MKLKHTTIIAEAGVNHNGSIAMALKLVDAAANAGADYVKFQTFKASNLASDKAAKADYQRKTTRKNESQIDMLRRLELSAADHKTLIARCRARGIGFLSTPFDDESLTFLAEELGLDLIKLPSGEITNTPLLLKAARTGCDIILSTGMADLKEIELALSALAFGYTSAKGAPSLNAFRSAYKSTKGRAALKKHVTLLHCTTEYPAPFEDVNLRAMETMAEAFQLPVGYSDHTPGIAISIAAVAHGALSIEKHMTLDRTLPGPDHRASIEPGDFKAMVKSIREVEQSIGDGRKICRPSEMKNKAIARKSLVAAEAIAKGEIFTEKNLTAKRPGHGRTPSELWAILGKRAGRAYAKDDLI
jgi:N-acetylneuraminate synthase